MHWTISIILCAMWLLAVFSGYMLGGFIHILLVIAIIVMLTRIFQGRKLKA